MWMIQGVTRSCRCLAAVSSEVARPWSGRLITQRRYSQELERIFSVLDRCNLKELGQFLDQHPQAVNYRGGDKTTPLYYLAGSKKEKKSLLVICSFAIEVANLPFSKRLVQIAQPPCKKKESF